jgi:hypothetical protein
MSSKEISVGEIIYRIPQLLQSRSKYIITNRARMDGISQTTANKLYQFAPGLNIEGGYPFIDLHESNPHALWVNAIVVLDRPILDNFLFCDLVEKIRMNNYPLLENAIDNLNEHHMLARFLLVTLYYVANAKPGSNIVIHFHQDVIAKNLVQIFDIALGDLMNANQIPLMGESDMKQILPYITKLQNVMMLIPIS